MVEKINFQDLFVDLLSNLSEREQEVLKRRYHLLSEIEKKATLKQIGDDYNITRERVRQIEREAVKKLIKLAEQKNYAESLSALEKELIAHLQQNGGISREDHLLEDFLTQKYNLDFLRPNAYLFVLENFFDTLKRVSKHEYVHDSWMLKEIQLEWILDLVKKLENSLAQIRKPHSYEGILGLAEQHLPEDLKAAVDKYLQNHTGLELKTALDSYLKTNKRISNNILNEWGLTEWQRISPKKLGYKIRLVFEKNKKPIHFRQIAEIINQADFDGKNICPATVHNELIANNDFVLIGRGIYALREWGYKTGTVAEIITRILRESASPLERQEIYKKVLEQRQVNESTIYLTLINKERFQKNKDGRFGLK
ncbi:MAG TPA: sigma factor-like helix-turn-helix DNA-binding protein [Patescibacteria group bacterium]|nr:sigma factor-like helix-turn-helix DNA-binding protein [Patescibacteria group bacterium]